MNTLKTAFTIMTAILLTANTAVAQGLNIGTNMIITGGTIMYVDGNLLVDGGTITFHEGTSLIMGNNRTLSVNDGGSLLFSGSIGNPTLMSSPGYFGFEINSGGTIGAGHSIFERMNADGIHIKPGANVDPSHPFDNSTFRNGITGGTLLTVNNNQVFTVNNALFPANTWGGSYNVTKTVDQGEVHFVNATGGFAGTPFENDPFARVFWGDELMTHSIPLPAGWSGLSSYVMPANNDIVDIFSHVAPNFIIAQTMTQAYYPAGSLNTIGSWNSQSAYKVKMSSPDVLDVSGDEESNKIFDMSGGWNLLPVITNQPVNVASLFAGTGVQLVKDVAGVGVYWPDYGINTLGSLLPGSAYYARLAAPASVQYPDNAKLAWTALLPEVQHPDHPWNKVIVTGSTHLIAISAEGSMGILPDDILGVFTPDNICYGVVQIIDPANNFFITAYSDDQTTAQKDGFASYELMNLKIYRPKTGEIHDVEVEYDLNMPQTGYFAGEGLSAVKVMKLGATGIGSASTAANISIYPNPAKNQVTVSGISDVNRVELYDTSGRLVRAIDHDGQTTLNIDLGGLNAGIYQIKLTGDSISAVKKIVKQ